MIGVGGLGWVCGRGRGRGRGRTHGRGTWDLGTLGGSLGSRQRGPRLDPARLDFFGFLAQVRIQGQGSTREERIYPGRYTVGRCQEVQGVQSRYLEIPLAARRLAKYRPRSHLANDGTTQPVLPVPAWHLPAGAQYACLVLSCPVWARRCLPYPGTPCCGCYGCCVVVSSSSGPWQAPLLHLHSSVRAIIGHTVLDPVCIHPGQLSQAGQPVSVSQSCPAPHRDSCKWDSRRVRSEQQSSRAKGQCWLVPSFSLPVLGERRGGKSSTCCQPCPGECVWLVRPLVNLRLRLQLQLRLQERLRLRLLLHRLPLPLPALLGVGPAGRGAHAQVYHPVCQSARYSRCTAGLVRLKFGGSHYLQGSSS